jgi:hypothetical protein
VRIVSDKDETMGCEGPGDDVRMVKPFYTPSKPVLTYEGAATASEQGEPVGQLGRRNIFDAIRGAYDLGYNDARNARAVPGDSAPGYDGRNVEADHGGALFNTLNRRLHTAQPAPAARPMPDAKALEIAGRVSTCVEAIREAEAHHRIGSRPTAPAVTAEWVVKANSILEDLAAFESGNAAGSPVMNRAQIGARAINLLRDMLSAVPAAAVPADRDVFVVNLMRHTTLTKTQARALLAHWLDGVEPGAALFATAAVPAVPAVPEGWQLVPVEVTPEMVGAFADATDDEPIWHQTTEEDRQETIKLFGPCYRALLASAPTSTKGGAL